MDSSWGSTFGYRGPCLESRPRSGGNAPPCPRQIGESWGAKLNNCARANQNRRGSGFCLAHGGRRGGKWTAPQCSHGQSQTLPTQFQSGRGWALGHFPDRGLVHPKRGSNLEQISAGCRKIAPLHSRGARRRALWLYSGGTLRSRFR